MKIKSCPAVERTDRLEVVSFSIRDGHRKTRIRPDYECAGSQAIDSVHRSLLDAACKQRYYDYRNQFLAMAFAQITLRESLRDIEACLRECSHLYAMGIRGNITRTNLADANEHCDWRVYEAFAQVRIRKTRRFDREDSNGLDIDEMVYAIELHPAKGRSSQP